MEDKSQFTQSPDRKFSFPHIRNVGFMGDHYNFECVYNALSSCEPDQQEVDVPSQMIQDGTSDCMMPPPVIAVSTNSCKYNLFCGRAVQECLLPFLADGVISSALIFPDGSLSAFYWENYFALKKNYNLPSMIVLGGINQESPAGFFRTVENLKTDHKINALAFVIPIGEFAVADLLEEKCFEFSHNGQLLPRPVPEEFAETVRKARAELISAAANEHEGIMQDFIEEKVPDTEEVRKVLRQEVIAGNIVPVFYCKPFHRRSFSIIYGAEMLLDAIVDYLPSPVDASEGLKNAAVKSGIRYCCDDAPFSAVVLARTSDTACIRVLSGTLSAGGSFINSRTGKNISLPFAESVFSGDTAFITQPGAYVPPQTTLVRSSYLELPGSDWMKAGLTDLLCDSAHRVTFRLPITLPEPVMAVTLPYAGKSGYDKLIGKLELMKAEFPSLRVFENLSAGTVTAAIDHKNVSALPLFLSSASKEKIQTEVLYREQLLQETVCEYEYTDHSGQREEYARCVLEVVPMEAGNGITINDCTAEGSVPPNFIDAIHDGITEAVWAVEPPRHYPLAEFNVNIIECSSKPDVSTPDAFRKAAFACLKAAAEKAGTKLLEPVADISIKISENSLPGVLTVLTECRGVVRDVVSQPDSYASIKAEVPFAEYSALSAALRQFQCGEPFVLKCTFAPVP